MDIHDVADKVERFRECQDGTMQVRILQLTPRGCQSLEDESLPSRPPWLKSVREGDIPKPRRSTMRGWWNRKTHREERREEIIT